MSVEYTRWKRSRKEKRILQFIPRQSGGRSGEEFDCECGQFAHMRMLYSHVLKALDFILIKEIPWKHIVKRWTRDARHILLPHLTQYQKDNAHKNSFSYRHFNMSMHDMKLVRMGDTSVEAYTHLISMIKNCAAGMTPFAEIIRDSLGLEDMMAENGDVVNQVQTQVGIQFAPNRVDSVVGNDETTRLTSLVIGCQDYYLWLRGRTWEGLRQAERRRFMKV